MDNKTFKMLEDSYYKRGYPSTLNIIQKRDRDQRDAVEALNLIHLNAIRAKFGGPLGFSNNTDLSFPERLYLAINKEKAQP